MRVTIGSGSCVVGQAAWIRASVLAITHGLENLVVEANLERLESVVARVAIKCDRPRRPSHQAAEMVGFRSYRVLYVLGSALAQIGIRRRRAWWCTVVKPSLGSLCHSRVKRTVPLLNLYGARERESGSLGRIGTWLSMTAVVDGGWSARDRACHRGSLGASALLSRQATSVEPTLASLAVLTRAPGRDWIATSRGCGKCGRCGTLTVRRAPDGPSVGRASP